ncbi:hypothetical protein Vadar_032721 [Vaccinium darrowii]|uniref:Uncharacterized protein n=1 Tax=Vaccinium darrowii TaxID=229202 RepID=A0ACB7ZP32_9ERIC|nr:hypothetical protein Vadar_032721 [Vaccinium darrowii]
MDHATWFQYFRTYIPVLQLKIRDLFKDHQELVAGFNAFVAVGCEIHVKDQIQYLNGKADDFEDAFTFLTKVKEAYRHDESRYKSFLALLDRIKADTVADVFTEEKT